MIRLFRKLLVSESARTLGRENARQYRQRVRRQCDIMREAMGMEPVQWR